MKLLLLFAMCIFSTCVFAQLPKKINPHGFQLPDTVKRFKGNENALQQLHDYWQRKQMQNNVRTDNNNSVVILPQDKMPCIVPDTTGISKMPNAWGATTLPYTPQFHPIPNPALPKPQSFGLKIPDNGLQSQGK